MTTEIPIGGIISWVKSFSNTPQTLPHGWIECNGQAYSDPQSVFNGQTIPDLNGSLDGVKKFLRGQTSSGGTGGAETHSHSVNYTTQSFSSGGGDPVVVSVDSTNSPSHIPPYYEIVWIIRIK